MNPWNCLTAKESRCCCRQIINAGAHLYKSAGLTPPIPGREPEDFFEYVEDNPALFYTRLQMPAADRSNLRSAYAALGSTIPLRMDQYQWSETFTYDSRDNRTAVTTAWGNTVTNTYDAANRQLSSGSRRFSYDKNGNLLSETLGTEQIAYAYNGADRMVSVSSGQPIQLTDRYPGRVTSAAYHYDALGRRVQEDYRRTQTTPGSGGRTTEQMDQGTRITFYDALGFNPTARLEHRGRVNKTIEANGTVSAQTRCFDNPALKQGLSYAGNELVLQTGLNVYLEDARTMISFRDETYLHQDQLDSTILTSSASGENIRNVDYDAFGQVLNRSVTTPEHLYNGKPQDPMTRLVNYGFRDYSPRQGRFTTIDPIRSGDNWYGYVENNPLNAIDPTGLEMVIKGSDEFKKKALADMQKLTRDTLGIRNNGTVIITKVNDNKGNLDSGTELVRRMNTKHSVTKREKDKHIITIEETGEGNSWKSDKPIDSGTGKGTPGTINYNPSSNPLISTKDPETKREVKTRRPPQIGLAHELIHADHAREGTVQGKLDESGNPKHKLGTYTYINKDGKLVTAGDDNIEEIRTMGLGYNLIGDVTENQIRKENNLNERCRY